MKVTTTKVCEWCDQMFEAEHPHERCCGDKNTPGDCKNESYKHKAKLNASRIASKDKKERADVRKAKQECWNVPGAKGSQFFQ